MQKIQFLPASSLAPLVAGRVSPKLLHLDIILTLDQRPIQMNESIKLIEYNIWANRRVIEQIRSLPVDYFYKDIGGSFPSLRFTLIHLLQSDYIWMNRWKGKPYVDPPASWSTNDIQSVSHLWYPVQEEIRALVKQGSLGPDAEVHFTTKKGNSFTLSFLDSVIHSTNHGTFHRGQVINMIRMLGFKPVATDYFVYCNELRNGV